MKKLLLFVSIFTLGFTSCGTDDQPASAPFEGKWEYFQVGEIVNGQEDLMPYDHTAGCTKDFIIITPTTVTDHSFYMEGTPASCIEEIYSGTYTRNGNTVTTTDDGEIYVSEIVQLDANTLKMKDTDTFEGETTTYITVMKRVD